MNIGMILDSTFPPDPRVENEASTLIDAGFDVSLFCLDYENQKDSREVINGIQVYRKACSKLVYKLSALAYTLPFYKYVLKGWIREFIKETKVDAIHIHDMQVASAVFSLRELKELSVVLDLHENRPEIMKYYNHLQKFPGKLLISPSRWAKFESRYIKKSSATVVVTEEAKAYYSDKLDLDPNKFIVVPNTIRASFKKAAVMDTKITQKYKDNFVILYVGDTGIRRGLLTVIQSMQALVRDIPKLKLVIVGSNKSDVILKNKVLELGLERYVDFEGWKDFTLFQSYISVSDICISPLHRNVHHDTTYANKIFQYMAFAKPLVVSDCLAQETVIKKANSGLVHEAENVDDFTNQIMKLHSDESLRKKLGENGKQFVDHEYSWEITSEGLVNYYKEIDEHAI